MRKSAPSSGFSRKHGFLTDKLQGLYDRNANTNDTTKIRKKKPCKSVPQAPKPAQQKSTTSETAPPAIRSITTSNQTYPPALNRKTWKGIKTDTHVRHRKHNSMQGLAAGQATTPHSTPTHDNGHIHQASPIRGLPLELPHLNNKLDYQHPFPQQTMGPAMTPLATTAGEPTNTTTTTESPATTATSSTKSQMGDGHVALRFRTICDKSPAPAIQSTNHAKAIHLKDANTSDQMCQCIASIYSLTATATEERQTDQILAQDPIDTMGEQQHKGTNRLISQHNKIAHVGQDKIQHFGQRYDLRICLQQKKQALSKWEAFNEFLTQLQAIDPMIMMYLWQSKHTKGFPPISITAAQHTFFDLETYAPRLVSHSRCANPVRHPYLFLASLVSPDQLVESLGPWL